jgi:hypothetical protein|tara:strand:+ start:449 stop:574 length:126 start_codon:yes stop_codon:yes gene_type:complete
MKRTIKAFKQDMKSAKKTVSAKNKKFVGAVKAAVKAYKAAK